jgi:peptidoglycan-N-acetylmuramic acid deacetylase
MFGKLFLPLMLTVLLSPAVNWGLYPNTRGQTPTPPENGAALLREYGGLFVADTNEKRVYLTFDLGYESGHTGAVLDILKAHNIKAVFFLCGNYLKERKLVARMIGEGHLIGNHTDRHRDLPTLTDDEIEKDIMDFQNKFSAEYPNAAAPVFFRPPKGRFDERTLKIAKDNNLRAMLWSSAIIDWNKVPFNAQAGANKILSHIHNGAIILSHITNSATPAMLQLLLPRLAEKGYTVGSVNELL